MNIKKTCVACLVVSAFSSFANAFPEYRIIIPADGLTIPSEITPEPETPKEEPGLEDNQGAWLEFLKAEGKIPKATTSLDAWSKNKISVDLSNPKYSNDNLPKFAIGLDRIYGLNTYNSKIQNYDFMKGIKAVDGSTTIGPEASSIRGFSDLVSVNALYISSKIPSSSDYNSALKNLSQATKIDISKSNMTTLLPFKNIGSGEINVGPVAQYRGQKPDFSTPFCKGIQSKKLKAKEQVGYQLKDVAAKDVCKPENNPWLDFYHDHGHSRYSDILSLSDLRANTYLSHMALNGEMLSDSDFPSVSITSAIGDEPIRSVSLKGQRLLTNINWMSGVKKTSMNGSDSNMLFSDMPSLTNISGLSTLEVAGTLDFSGDSSLSDISALAGIKTSVRVILTGTPAESKPDVLNVFKNMSQGSILVSKKPSKVTGSSAFCQNYSGRMGVGTSVYTTAAGSISSTTALSKGDVCL